MGKYSNSEIHNKYSDFHWNLIEVDEKYKKLYTCDIDRLWIEYDFSHNEIVGILDLKWLNSTDSITPTENGVYDWFRKHNVKVFTVFIDKSFTKFKVLKDNENYWYFNKIQYADFLLALRSRRKYRDFFDNYKGYIEINDSDDFAG
jgi:hypothetical protein